jgi:subtilase family serine protease
MSLGSARPRARYQWGRGRVAASAAAVAVTVMTAGVLAAQAAPAHAQAAWAQAAQAQAAPARAAQRESDSPAAGMRRACKWPPAPGTASCFALYQPQTSVNRAIARGLAGRVARPQGLTPKEIESAYRLPVSRQSHQTVAVSIAYNTPHLAYYLRVYRNYFGLPPCTVKSGCFRVVNQDGGSKNLPPSGRLSGWDLEVTLDVSMISVACPHCHILVVEANNANLGPLGKTERTAARLGAQVISNSYGQPENGLAMTYAHYYRPKHHTVVVASGDNGFTTANFPANLATVTAVGGTELARSNDPRGWREKVWNNSIGAGSSGCSAYVPRPSWQHRVQCPGRTIADVAAVAWNVPIYNKAWGGWITVGGTSVAAPLIAGIYGLAGNGDKVTTKTLYQHPRSFYHIGTGNNAWGLSPKLRCGDDYLCVATPGYNAPTGLGTPHGISAF